MANFANMTISGATIANNSAANYGGGMYNYKVIHFGAAL